ncbi:MAG: cation:proton antiporter [Candidatus Woesearchaeota archaeon]
MEALVIILVCLTASYLLGEFFEGLQLPRVLGSLLVGVFLGLPLIQLQFFDPFSENLLLAFADLGVIFIMFYVGIRLDLTEIKNSSKSAGYIALFNAVVPFVFGFLAVKLLALLGLIHVANPNIVGLIVGGIIAVTAETESIDLLSNFRLLKSKIGKTIIAADLFDNIVEALLVSFIVTFIHYLQTPVYGILIIVFDAILFFILVYLSGYIIVPFLMKFISRRQPKIDLFIVSLILSLFMAVISEYMGLGSIIGALLAGMIMNYAILKDGKKDKYERQIIEAIELTTFGFMAPFFFIWVGMHANFSFLITNPWLGIIIIVAALGGKLIGSIIGTALSKGTLVEALTIGWAMNTRGAVELVVAEIARQNNIITTEIFSALVLMAFFTTIISPLFFKFYIKRYHIKA